MFYITNDNRNLFIVNYKCCSSTFEQLKTLNIVTTTYKEEIHAQLKNILHIITYILLLEILLKNLFHSIKINL